MLVKITISDFLADNQGARFADVVNDARVPFQKIVDFFNDAEHQKRMEQSEKDYDKPALGGVVRDFENEFEGFLGGYDSHTTRRHHQAVGVVVRIIMEHLGWHKTGRKGSLGRRKAVAPGTTTPGAYNNKSGLSKWFTKAERYER
jgi:hypothetical protein